MFRQLYINEFISRVEGVVMGLYNGSMKVKDVRFEKNGRKVRLSARCKIRKVGWDRVYFEFDAKYAPWIVADASPFAAALLIPAMKMGEDLEIGGLVSNK